MRLFVNKKKESLFRFVRVIATAFVIGRKGQIIKTIGIEARREIEEILETKVFLDLQVKVRERWRDSADVLDLIEGQKRF